jgi:UDP-N-acetylglucosamine transferase subunit ALG13
MNGAAPQPLVFVTVGTEQFPFDRLVGWVDEWIARRTEGSTRFVCQCGTSAPPRSASNQAFMTYEAFTAALASASLVVCHGGPSTIFQARASGRLPIVVPRRRAFGEHVDDHQVVFARRLAAQDTIRLADERDDLHTLLDEGMADPARFRVDSQPVSVAPAVARFAALADALLGRHG